MPPKKKTLVQGQTSLFGQVISVKRKGPTWLCGSDYVHEFPFYGAVAIAEQKQGTFYYDYCNSYARSIDHNQVKGVRIVFVCFQL